jgi:hypothetical protein
MMRSSLAHDELDQSSTVGRLAPDGSPVWCKLAGRTKKPQIGAEMVYQRGTAVATDTRRSCHENATAP